MIRSMRRLSQTWLIKILMLFLVVSFALWGIGDMFRGNPLQRAVATAGDEKITVEMLDRNFRTQVAQYRKSLGPDFTEDVARRAGMLDPVLKAMIERSLIQQNIRDLGLRVANKDAFSLIMKDPAFRGKDGKFDPDLMTRVLAENHINQDEFVGLFRDNIARKILSDSLMAGINPPKTLVESLTAARGAQRVLEILTIDDSAIADIPTPDDAALAKFHQDHADRFMAAESRDVSVLKLMLDRVEASIKVSDEELKQAYDQRLAEYARPERRSFLQVVVQDEAAARKLAKEAAQSKDLKKTARAHGYEEIALEDMTEKTILPELYATAFALTGHQVGEAPVQSPLGWHVLQLTEVKPAGTENFEDIRDQLASSVKRDRAMDQMQALTDKVDDGLAGGKSLDELTTALDLPLVRIEGLTADGTLPQGKKAPADAPDLKTMARYAYGLTEGEASSLIDDRQGNFLVVRADKITEKHVRPLADIRNEVAKAWKEARQAEKAAAKADEMAKAVREGAAMSKFADGKGVRLRMSKPVTQLGQTDTDIPQAFLPQIFAMRQGETSLASDGGKHYVLRLAELKPADPARKSDRNRVADILTRDMADDLATQYTQHLRRIYPVETNEKLLASLKTQGE